ncbi:PadR family transcriptional regulator [Pseudarthrobacter sp. J1738]|uniref:PadR family transcriptional regulator n=1 Tax=Pseudarthrobacter sp. J1738 TaxID=3420446 RepID=UPI003D2E9970
MSIRHSLLALLQDQRRYGYDLRVEFEERTGSTWPLNIGQVYTTLDRLERDGLVLKDGDDGEGHVIYSITPAGTAEVQGWFAAPVERSNPPRNELAIKLALAVTLPGVDVPAIISAQRVASMRSLQDYTKARRDTAANQRSSDTAWLLVLDSLIFQTEAEVRWLDLCEARLAQLAASRAASINDPDLNQVPRTTVTAAPVTRPAE